MTKQHAISEAAKSAEALEETIIELINGTVHYTFHHFGPNGSQHLLYQLDRCVQHHLDQVTEQLTAQLEAPMRGTK